MNEIVEVGSDFKGLPYWVVIGKNQIQKKRPTSANHSPLRIKPADEVNKNPYIVNQNGEIQDSNNSLPF